MADDTYLTLVTVVCVTEHKRCPTGKISQQQIRVQTERFRMQTLRTPQRRAGCAPEDTLVCVSGNALVLRAERRAGLRAGRRAVSARRETRRSARR